MAEQDRPGWTLLVLGRPGKGAQQYRLNTHALTGALLVFFAAALGTGYALNKRSNGRPPIAAGIDSSLSAAVEVPESTARTGAAAAVTPIAARAPSVEAPRPAAKAPPPIVAPAQSAAETSAPGEPLLIQRDRPGEEVLELHPFAVDGSSRASDFERLEAKLACGDGHRHAPESALVRVLLDACREFGKPILLLGGRCPAHHDLPDTSEYHRVGRAADIRIRGVSTEQLMSWLVKHRVGGVGRYPHAGFLHVDVRTTPHEPWEADEAVVAKPAAKPAVDPAAPASDDGVQPHAATLKTETAEPAPSAETTP